MHERVAKNVERSKARGGVNTSLPSTSPTRCLIRGIRVCALYSIFLFSCTVSLNYLLFVEPTTPGLPPVKLVNFLLMLKVGLATKSPLLSPPFNALINYSFCAFSWGRLAFTIRRQRAILPVAFNRSIQ